MTSRIWGRRAVAVFAMMAGIFGASLLRAEDGAAPGRAVRLSSVDGQVQVSQGGDVLADHALINTPLFEGSEITTGDDGRAEIQFDDGSVARIPPQSSLILSILKPGGETEVTLESGMGFFELQGNSQASPFRVRFASDAVTASGFTVLRIKLDEGPGELAVFSGNAHLDGTNGASMDLHGGESVSADNLNISEAIEPDSWDAWNSDRDQALTATEADSTQATDSMPNANNPAWGDLNSNGTWYDVPDQGYVWSPYDASNAGWDPWAEGYWVYAPRYGYMWVSTYSWGYLPYQCGMWNWYGGFGWGWAPGMCNDPWWGSGVWGFNVGYMPPWYRLPMRPTRPLNPRPMQPGTRVAIGLRPTAPVISVNRRSLAGTTPLPPRETGHPVQIGSVIAQPLRPMPPRSSGGPSMGFTHTTPVSIKPSNGSPTMGANPRSTRQGYVPARPSYTPATGYAPASGYGTTRPGYMPAPQPGMPRSPASPSAPRMPSGSTYHEPSAPRPSSGGGSHPAPSGGGHPSGGGGGGSHTSGSSHK